jgi:hypothetical protein
VNTDFSGAWPSRVTPFGLPSSGEGRAAETERPHIARGTAELSTVEQNELRDHPELRKAAIVSALQRAVCAVQEGDEMYALSETGFASKLLRGRVS